MRRRILSAAVTLVLAVGLSFVLASPARAHNAWGCPHGQSCLFLNYDGGGWIMPIVWSSHPKDTCINMVSFYRNEASSAVVDFGSGWDLVVFEDIDCGDAGTALKSVWQKSFKFYWTENSWNWLQDDVESFKIRCLQC